MVREILSAAILLTAFAGCLLYEADDETAGPQPARVIFEVVGGWEYDSLAVRENGIVALDMRHIPELQLQLTGEEHADLLALFEGFHELPDEFPEDPCEDDAKYTVTHEVLNRSRKSVSGWQCFVELGNDSDSMRVRFRTIVRALNQLRQKMYREAPPWRGLEISYTSDREVYDFPEPIELTIRVMNPTAGTRKLYFPYDTPIWVQILCCRLSEHYYYPYKFPLKSVGLDSLILDPGENVVFNHTLQPSELLSGAPQEPARLIVSFGLATAAGHSTDLPLSLMVNP